MKKRYVLSFITSCSIILLLIIACSVDLDVPEGRNATGLQVQVEFINHHAGVQGSWQGTLVVDRCSNVPQDINAKREAQQSLTYISAVVPGQLVNFDTFRNMCPGTWNIRVTVTDGTRTIIDVPCIGFNIPDTLGENVTLGLKVIEGSNECTASDTRLEAWVPPRDIAILPFEVPATVYQGEQVSIDIPVRNNGAVPTESFTIQFNDSPATGSPGAVSPPSQGITDLAVNTQTTVRFQWNSAGASIGNHNLNASVAPLLYERNTTNNAQSATVNVVPPPDVEVTGVSVTGPVILGGSYPVTVNVKNNGSLQETLTVNLTDTPPTGPAVTVGTSSSLVLGPSGQADDTASYMFTWNTSGITPGQHTLTAWIPPLPAEVITPNNTRLETVTVENHDVQAISLTAPASANVGVPVQVTASVRNNGNISENMASVVLKAQTPSGGEVTIGTQTVTLNVGETRPMIFNWDTACIASGNYTLTATVSAPYDSNAANNSSAAVPIVLSIDRELSIAFVDPIVLTVPQGSRQGYIVRLTNGKSISEPNIAISFTDTPQGGPPGWIAPDPRLPVTLQCGQTFDLIFFWGAPSAFSASHQLTVAITNSIVGDDPIDNSATITVNVP